MKRFIRRAILGVIVAVAILAVVIALLPNPIEADSTSVRRGPLRVTVEEEGETRCRIRYVVAAPITGRLERVSLDEGQTLAKGEVVGRMYPPPIDSRQKAEAQARVTAAESSLEEAQALMNVARAEAEQCGRSRARAERLVEDGLISREQYEMAETTERTAAETVKASVSRVERARAEVMQARTALIAAGTEIWSKPLTLYSPARGIVLRVFEESERIVAAGTAILEIGDASALEVVVDVLSSDAAAIHAGAEVELNGWGGTVLRGRVRTVEPAAFTKLSALGVEEQRVNVIVDFAEAASEIGVGYRVHARIVIWTGDDVLKVPTGALVRSGEDWGVFAVVEGRARLHRIVVGHRNQLEVEVLAGLVEGEQLVVHPPSDLVDGARVATVGQS